MADAVDGTSYAVCVIPCDAMSAWCQSDARDTTLCWLNPYHTRILPSSSDSKTGFLVSYLDCLCGTVSAMSLGTCQLLTSSPPYAGLLAVATLQNVLRRQLEQLTLRPLSQLETSAVCRAT